MRPRPTTDELKLYRDGHLGFGRRRRGPLDGVLWPVTTRVGYDADGQPVASCESFGPESGEVEYGDYSKVVRWEITEAGKHLWWPEESATPRDAP